MHEKLIISDEAIEFLQKITTPISVVAVVGPLHTGKSFLMNQLLGKNTFGIGHKVTPNTMGLWVDVLEPASPSKTTLLLDSEGLFAPNISEVYDAKIFSVSAFLSSYLIYNTMRIIDEQEIDYLELLSRRAALFSFETQLKLSALVTSVASTTGTNGAQSNAKDIAVKPKTGDSIGTEVESLRFPPLLWVVQSFFQDLLGQSAKEWLQKLLEARPSEKADGKGLSMYNDIDCATLFVPHHVRAKLNALDLVDSAELSQIYRDGIAEIRRKVASAPIKQFGGREVTGPEFISLLRLIVHAANTLRFPSLPSVWDGFMKLTALEAVEESVKYYARSFEERFDNNAVHSSPQLRVLAGELKARAIEIFSQYTFEIPSFVAEKSELERQIVVLEREFVARNGDRIQAECQRVKSNAKQALQRQVAALKLPIMRDQLKELESKLKSEALTRYADELAELQEETEYDTNLQTLRNEAGGELAGLAKENVDALREVLKSARVASQDAFVHTLSENKMKPLTSPELATVFEDAVTKGIAEFMKRAGDFAEDALAEGIVAGLHVFYDDQKVAFTDANNERIATELKRSFPEFRIEMVQAFQSIALPKSSAAVKAESADLFASVSERWRKRMHRFEGTAGFDKALHDMKEFYNGQVDITLSDNKHRMRRLQEDEWNSLRTELSAEMGKFYLQSSFEAYALKAAENRLSTKVTDQALANELALQFVELEVPQMAHSDHVRPLIDTNSAGTLLSSLLSLLFETVRSMLFGAAKN